MLLLLFSLLAEFALYLFFIDRRQITFTRKKKQITTIVATATNSLRIVATSIQVQWIVIKGYILAISTILFWTVNRRLAKFSKKKNRVLINKFVFIKLKDNNLLKPCSKFIVFIQIFLETVKAKKKSRKNISIKFSKL